MNLLSLPSNLLFQIISKCRYQSLMAMCLADDGIKKFIENQRNSFRKHFMASVVVTVLSKETMKLCSTSLSGQCTIHLPMDTSIYKIAFYLQLMLLDKMELTHLEFTVDKDFPSNPPSRALAAFCQLKISCNELVTTFPLQQSLKVLRPQRLDYSEVLPFKKPEGIEDVPFVHLWAVDHNTSFMYYRQIIPHLRTVTMDFDEESSLTEFRSHIERARQFKIHQKLRAEFRFPDNETFCFESWLDKIADGHTIMKDIDNLETDVALIPASYNHTLVLFISYNPEAVQFAHSFASSADEFLAFHRETVDQFFSSSGDPEVELEEPVLDQIRQYFK